MNASSILLEKKYVRVINCFATKAELSLDEALKVFYNSVLYKLLSEGVSDLHCMSDEYIADELFEEYTLNASYYLRC